jgi:hypothetical protein
MSKHWARETRDGIQDFNVDRDLLLTIMIYRHKTGTNVNHRAVFTGTLDVHRPSPLPTCQV